jgi:hypothetical protein
MFLEHPKVMMLIVIVAVLLQGAKIKKAPERGAS